MSITREELEVGETYEEGITGLNRVVRYIGQRRLFYNVKNTASEGEYTIADFMRTHSLIPKEREKITLYECLDNHGNFSGFYNDEHRHPIFSNLAFSACTYSRVRTGRTIEIYKDNFEVVL